ncbi:SIR2 family protein [Shewanella halifaxensis]|uniref:SIR2 family protein n=1 Tax=Shewanella halifaxensis TaxID=271098 RepID=UPI000D58C9E1|nr:SIR2 family protein [Shewanella halifaxensis]
MIDFRVATEKALLSAIQRSKNEIALLVGSPLSSPHQAKAKGVPTVGGVLNLIDDYLDNDDDLKTEYEQEILTKYQNDNDRYQKSFEFLADYTDPEVPNLIIRQAVLHSTNIDINQIDCTNLEQLSSLQKNLSNWHLPPATEAAANILYNHPQITGPILTTNFDPLLSIALEKLGYEPNRTVLHGDGSLDQLQSSRMNIVHLHGFWLDTDTMHTQSQLRLHRPKLKSSLTRILKNKTLLVLGYGGWDDIFMQTLKDIMDDESANFDVIWAFYENEKRIISEKYEKLIHAVQPAIGRNRFRVYGGINCHEFLPKLYSQISESGINKQPVKENKVRLEERGASKEQTSQDQDELTFNKESSIVPIWNIFSDPAHLHIREVERADIFDALTSNPIVNLTCDWGLGKDEFINTLIEDINSPVYQANLYRIDLSLIQSKNDLLDKIDLDFGFGLQSFINGMAIGNCLLCLDNYDSSLSRKEGNCFWEVASWLAHLVIEYNPKTKVIICSKGPLQHKIPCVQLSTLEEFDIRSYIAHHSCIHEKPDEHVIESLIELSRGIPSFIDRYIKELELISIDDIYDDHFSPEAHKHDQDSAFPSELKTRVNNLAKNSEEHSLRSYELLKVLSILEKGDSFTNLKKSNPSFNFRTSHLQELYNLELLEPLKINKNFLKTTNSLGDDKLHTLPPIVRDYVYSQLTTKEIYTIVKQISDIHLGKNWRSGSLKLSTLTKDLLSANSQSIGSTHIIIIHLLRCPIELNNSRGIKSALRICESYCMYLSRKSRHRELVKFIEQVKAIIKESDKTYCSLTIDTYEGEALRMIGKHDKAKESLLSVYERLKEEVNPEKDKMKSVLSSLAHLYMRKNNLKKANDFANELLEIDSNNVNARYIVAISSDHTSINELKDLEQYFRNNNDIITANNTCITITDMETSTNSKLKWLDKVLTSKIDPYNKFRAITKKGEILIKDKKELNFNSAEIAILHNSYAYSFSQKMMSLFNSSHSVLWYFYTQTNNPAVLLKLFKQSSLFWRIYENVDKEQLYSLKMLELMNTLLPESIDLTKHRYVTFRVRQISSKSEVIGP